MVEYRRVMEAPDSPADAMLRDEVQAYYSEWRRRFRARLMFKRLQEFHALLIERHGLSMGGGER